jgi:hypothetical protein
MANHCRFVTGDDCCNKTIESVLASFWCQNKICGTREGGRPLHLTCMTTLCCEKAMKQNNLLPISSNKVRQFSKTKWIPENTMTSTNVMITTPITQKIYYGPLYYLAYDGIKSSVSFQPRQYRITFTVVFARSSHPSHDYFSSYFPSNLVSNAHSPQWFF